MISYVDAHLYKCVESSEFIEELPLASKFRHMGCKTAKLSPSINLKLHFDSIDFHPYHVAKRESNGHMPLQP